MPKLSGLNADFAREVAMVFQRGIQKSRNDPHFRCLLEGAAILLTQIFPLVIPRFPLNFCSRQRCQQLY